MTPQIKAPAAWSTAVALFASLCAYPAIGSACAVCFGAPDDPQTKGLNMAIFVMIGVTYVVVLGMAAMFIAHSVRARRRTPIAQQGEHVAC
jgi:heme/copper-type cytochrome/quinol oxidase subunit 2